MVPGYSLLSIQDLKITDAKKKKKPRKRNINILQLIKQNKNKTSNYRDLFCLKFIQLSL